MKERTYGKMEWFFYIIILPLLFTGLISGIVLQFMGYDVTGKLMSVARHTPVISSIVPPDEQTKQELSEVRKLQSQLDEAQKALTQVQQSASTSKQDLSAKEAELNKLKEQMKQSNQQSSDQQTADEYWKKQAKVYSQMSPKNAAGLLSALPMNQAKAILDRLGVDDKASILEKMDPKTAALLQSDLTAMQESGLQSADDYFKAKSSLYSTMAPDKAAAILSQLPSNVARAILLNLDVQTRSAILENMKPDVASKLI